MYSNPALRLLILEAGALRSAPHGGYPALLRDIISCDTQQINIDVVSCFTTDFDPLPPETYDACIVTGSSAMVSDPPAWLHAVAQYVLRLLHLRIGFLGICFGHHLLAKLCGGLVARSEFGWHIGSTTPRLDSQSDQLFTPNHSLTESYICHRERVVELGSDLIGIATAPNDPHHAIRFRDHAWGIQFHPELTLSPLINPKIFVSRVI